MVEQDKDKKADKISRFLSGISLLDEGETITPTAFAKRISMHPNTAREKLEEYELAKSIGWRTIYGKDGFARLIIKEENDIFLKSQIAEIKKEIIDIKSILDQIKAKINKKKN